MNGGEQPVDLLVEAEPPLFHVPPGHIVIARQGALLWCGTPYDEPGGDAFEPLRAQFEGALDDAIALAQEPAAGPQEAG